MTTLSTSSSVEIPIIAPLPAGDISSTIGASAASASFAGVIDNRKATVATAKRPTQRSKVPRLPAHQLLRDRIRDRIDVLQKEQRDRPEQIRQHVNELTALIPQQQGPLAYRRKRILEREIDRLMKECQEIESGKRLRDYEQQTRPYLEMLDSYMTRVGITPTSASSSSLISTIVPPSVTNPSTIESTSTMPTVAASPKNNDIPMSWNDQDLFDDYMASVEGTSAAVHVLSVDKCATCKRPMILSADGSMIMCRGCGHGYPYVDATSAAIAYGDEVEFSTFTYRKYNHFVEWLTKFTYRESGVVPEKIMENVMRGLEEDGILPEQVNHQSVYAVLKRLSYRKYYDYLSQITTRITNKKPPTLSPEEEWKMKLLFRAIQGPFEKHCPQDRTNFLTCQFVADCLLRLIGREDLLPCLRPLKGLDKRAKQRATMEKILADLGLELPKSAYANPTTGTNSAYGGSATKASASTKSTTKSATPRVPRAKKTTSTKQKDGNHITTTTENISSLPTGADTTTTTTTPTVTGAPPLSKHQANRKKRKQPDPTADALQQ